jgi:hypothetical protein
MFETARYTTKQNHIPNRRKKINITPAQSVTAEGILTVEVNYLGLKKCLLYLGV